MRKRMYVLLLVFVLLFSSIQPVMGAELLEEKVNDPVILQSTGTCGGDLTWTYSGEELEISGTGAMNNYSLSDHAPWFQYSSNSPTKVTMDEGITRIGSYAFYHHRFSSIDIPSSVTAVREGAFRGCNSLTSITLSNNVAEIGERVCHSCTSLTSVRIGELINTIPKWAFAGCSNLEEIYLPDSITTIEYGAFEDCYELSDIYYFGTKESWGGIDINRNSGLSDSVTIHCLGPYTDNEIYSFSEDGTLTIKKTGDVEEWDYDYCPWEKCAPLAKKLVLSEGITSLDCGRLYYFEEVEEVIIPSTLTTFEDNDPTSCFQDEFPSLKNITVSESNEKYCSIDGILYNKDASTLYYYPAGKTNSSFSIPDSVVTVAPYAFENDYLKSLTISSSVKDFNSDCIYGNTQVQNPQIIVEPGNTYFTAIDGVLFDHSKENLILYPSGIDRECYTVPSEVKNIGKNAFYEARLKTIVLQEGVISIGDYALPGCNNLRTLYLPLSLKKIGNFSFSYWGDVDDKINDIYYAGSEEQWKEIELGERSDIVVAAATIHYGVSYDDGGNGSGDDPEHPDNPDNPDNPVNPDNPNNPDNPTNPDKPNNGTDSKESEKNKEPEISISDNKPMDYMEETRGSYTIGFNHSIPFWGKSKLTLANFGKITVSPNSSSSENQISYDVTKIKVNKKKHLIQITGLSGADKDTVKALKKLTKGSSGLSFTVNPYFVTNKDSVNMKRKKDGSIKSIKISINGKPYKAKKGEWKQVSANRIEFTGNLAGSYEN